MPVVLQALNRASSTAALEDISDSAGTTSAEASRWIQTNNISESALLEVFHETDGAFSVIATDLPGTADRDKTQTCYLLTGAAALLSSGTPSVDDKAARELTKKLGCYDSNNHSKSISALGNKITGSKKTGYRLTAPGLKAAAVIIMAISNGKD